MRISKYALIVALSLCSAAFAQDQDLSLVMPEQPGCVEIRAWSFSEDDGITIPDDLFMYVSDAYAPASNLGGPIAVTFPNVRAGDVFAVDFHGDTYSASLPGMNCAIQIFAEQGANTAPIDAGLGSFDTQHTSPMTLLGHYVAPANGEIRFTVMGRQWPAPAAGSMGFAERAYLRVTRYTN